MLVCRIKSDLHKINRLLLYTNCIKRVIIKPVIIKQLFSSTYFFFMYTTKSVWLLFLLQLCFFFQFSSKYVRYIIGIKLDLQKNFPDHTKTRPRERRVNIRLYIKDVLYKCKIYLKCYIWLVSLKRYFC